MFVAHVLPDHPALQLHVYLFTPSVQDAPFLHGELAQSLMLVWHELPENPESHVHLLSSLLLPLTQVPRFEHAFPSHAPTPGHERVQ